MVYDINTGKPVGTTAGVSKIQELYELYPQLQNEDVGATSKILPPPGESVDEVQASPDDDSPIRMIVVE